MDAPRRRPSSALLAVSGLAVVLVVAVAFALSLAADAGRLPWQGEPTRIPVTPFSDLPGAAPAAPEAP